MYLDVIDGSARVGEPDDCTSLEVRVADVSRPELDAILRSTGLGSWDGGAEADLAVGQLRVVAERSGVADDWARRWDAMIGYAGRKGWVSADGTTVRAHLVDVPAG